MREIPRNMHDYEETRREFVWPRPERFNFAKDVIDLFAAETPDRVALLFFGPSGERSAYSFADLRARSIELGRGLTALGLGPGDRVFLMLPRVAEWWLLSLACIRAGLVFMPAPTMLTPKDIAYRLSASGAKAIITDAENAPKVDRGSLARSLVRVSLGDAEGFLPYASLLGGDSATDPFPPTRAEDPLLLYFTSGTTGMPKMVTHTQASYGIGHQITGRYWLDLGPEDRHFTLSDTGWAKCAWGKLFGPWSMGACNVVHDLRGRFDPNRILSLIGEAQITTFCAPPTAYRAMILEDLGRQDLSSLRLSLSAGEPLNPEVIEVWRRATGLTIREGYGQTETVVIVGSFVCLEPRPGSMGKPSPGFDVAVIDDGGEELGPGLEGDIAVRVRPERPVGLFEGYEGDEEANARAFRGDFYVTGDRAVRDEDGYLWFVGRADDVIKTSGYRVGPFEVESALLEHAAVAESAVIGVPDERLGQRIKAFVVLKAGREGTGDLAREIQEHVRRVTAPYKYPREIEFVEQLPKTVSGKIRRVALRQGEGNPGA